jgi:hypothetical protein
MNLTYLSTKIKLLFIFLGVICFGCNIDRRKTKHSSTVRVCNKNLFVETYEIVGGGAYGGDLVSDYLTDSVNFRIYIGTYDNGDEGYSYKCTGDSVDINKVTGRRENDNKIVDKKIYSLLGLEKKKIFE